MRFALRAELTARVDSGVCALGSLYVRIITSNEASADSITWPVAGHTPFFALMFTGRSDERVEHPGTQKTHCARGSTFNAIRADCLTIHMRCVCLMGS